MKRTGMINIKDILRHRHDLGLPRAQIAAATGVSAGTVSHVLDRAEAAGLSWPISTMTLCGRGSIRRRYGTAGMCIPTGMSETGFARPIATRVGTPGIAGSVWRPAIHRSARRCLRHPAVIACQPVVREARRFFEIVACGRCRTAAGARFTASGTARRRDRSGTGGSLASAGVPGGRPRFCRLARPNRGRSVSVCPNR